MSEPIRIHDMPLDERPRERMLTQGAISLSHAELLAILLRTGTAKESALALAHRLLHVCGGLQGLSESTVEQLQACKGIGTAKALHIHAALELGKRTVKTTIGMRPALRNPQEVSALVMEEMRGLQQEHFVCLFLDTKCRLISRETISIGTVDQTLVSPRDVFRLALKRSATALICVHNHPSGDPTPSQADIAMTKRLQEVGILLGVSMHDHLIIGQQRYVSMKEQAYI